MISVRHLRLRSFTASRAFGADIPFDTGLNVIRAPNTSGKSTCLQAIVYALGLERALGPQLAIPLPYAMREQIHERKDDPYDLVLQSYVELEIENSLGRTVVIHRDIVGGKDTKLIQTWHSGSLSREEPLGQQRDFYVLDAGSASHESGFHTFLASFIGWSLPTVARYDGTESPLYLEAIFPMLFVEQKRGWSSIQGPFPTFLRIQDVARRVMEFLLDLESALNRRKRAEIRAAITDLVGKWTSARRSLEEAAARLGRIRGVPTQPNAEFAANPIVELQLFYDNDWTPLSEVIGITANRISNLEAAQQKTVEQVAPEIEGRLARLREDIDERSAVLETVRNEFNAEHQDSLALEVRVRSLEADLKRNQDAQKLQRLGSDLGTAASDQVCPTCHQEVTSELLPAVESVGMALDENIAFVKSQLELYRTALSNSGERLKDIRGRYRGAERELQDRQQQLRALRQELTRPSSATSRSDIEEIVRLQSFLDSLRNLDEAAMSLADDLHETAVDWAEANSELRRLPADELTPADMAKLQKLQAGIRFRLDQYGFRSFQPAEISLSNDNFRPLVIRVEDGAPVEKEINFEVSASDAIRLKWAYYLSCLELKGGHTTNHPGLLVFDEPGQQEIETSSLVEFLRSASRTLTSDFQVIVSTSEELEVVEVAVGDAAHVINFGGFILQPIEGKLGALT